MTARSVTVGGTRHRVAGGADVSARRQRLRVRREQCPDQRLHDPFLVLRLRAPASPKRSLPSIGRSDRLGADVRWTARPVRVRAARGKGAETYSRDQGRSAGAGRGPTCRSNSSRTPTGRPGAPRPPPQGSDPWRSSPTAASCSTPIVPPSAASRRDRRPALVAVAAPPGRRGWSGRCLAVHRPAAGAVRCVPGDRHR